MSKFQHERVFAFWTPDESTCIKPLVIHRYVRLLPEDRCTPLLEWEREHTRATRDANKTSLSVLLKVGASDENGASHHTFGS